MTLNPGDRYVALGSSYAAGPGLDPRAPDSPRRSGRSSVNYAHVVADRLRLDLQDVTFSGATSVDILNNGLGGEPPQIEAVTEETKLVTVTCGGNDVLYIGGLAGASMPAPLRTVLRLRKQAASLFEPADTELRFREANTNLRMLARELRRRAPSATVLFVDYLTLLPPDGTPAPPLRPDQARAGLELARRLASMTSEAALAEGCDVIRASDASVDHHAWATEPWTRGFHLSLRGGAPYHPTALGMREVANLIVDRVGPAV